MTNHKKITIGFTLAELLIALAILGVIATFTIPKILDSGSDSKFNSIAKEAIGMVSGAYQNYKLNNSISATTSFSDLTPFMNFVNIDTVTVIDDMYAGTTEACSDGIYTCLKLHNGALLLYVIGGTGGFSATTTTSTLRFMVDPDGRVTSTGLAGTAGKSVFVVLYTNGRIVTRGTITANTYWGTMGPYSADPSWDPPWFSWN